MEYIKFYYKRPLCYNLSLLLTIIYNMLWMLHRHLRISMFISNCRYILTFQDFKTLQDFKLLNFHTILFAAGCWSDLLCGSFCTCYLKNIDESAAGPQLHFRFNSYNELLSAWLKIAELCKQRLKNSLIYKNEIGLSTESTASQKEIHKPIT